MANNPLHKISATICDHYGDILPDRGRACTLFFNQAFNVGSRFILEAIFSHFFCVKMFRLENCWQLGDDLLPKMYRAKCNAFSQGIS